MVESGAWQLNAVQVLLTHDWVSPQALLLPGPLQPPQFSAEVAVSVHVPGLNPPAPHTTSDEGHAQVPLEHVAPAAQTVPQAPQF
jgi:hypothetical protein